MNATAAIWTVLGATGAATLFSALYVSLADLSRGRLEEIALRRSTGGAGAASLARVRRILDDVRGHARAMGLPRLLFSIVVIVAVLWWVEAIDESAELSLTEGVVAALSTAVGLWVCTIVLPMAIAAHAGEKVVYACSALIRAVYILESPLTPLARFIDEVVRRLAGNEPGDEASHLETELMSVIDEGRRGGQIDAEEEQMIGAVVELRDRTVEQIMTPRTEIAAMEYSDDLGAVTEVVRRIGHSRIPVYRDSLDNIAGIFYVKDLMRWLAGSGTRGGSGKVFELQSILRPALFVPETKTVRELMRELLEKKLHIAMVADEYGGTAGLVTIEDIVEEVFGEIYDEYEPEAEESERVGLNLADRSAAVDARAYIQEVNDAIEALGVAIPEGDEYDTVGGYVITTLGRIPERGESFREGRLTVHVEEATPTRVVKVRLEVRPAEEEPEAVEPQVEVRANEAADVKASAAEP
jgi:CBS domain containing-hemolysin-like protein